MKMAKKLIAVLLAAVLVFAFAACSGEGGANSENKLTAETIKIGVIHITSKDDVSGYTAAHQAGIVKMMQELGIKDEQVVIKDNIDDTNVEATKNALQELVDADCDIIFATSYNYMNAVEEYAAQYPDVLFSHCSGFKSNDTNFNNYFGRIYQARYLAGVAAGLKAKELNNPKLGFVAAMDESNAEVTGGIDAFALGAQSVYPEVEVKVSVTGKWYAPDEEAKAAQALIDAGCSVIGQHCDSDLTQKTIAAANAAGTQVYGCGYNSDMTAAAPETHLCAPIWNWEHYYIKAVNAAINGTFAEMGNYYEGMNEQLIDVSDLNTAAAAPGTQEKLDEVRAKLADGELIVFDAGMKKADGSTVDHALTDEEITQGLTYYVAGVSAL